MSNQTNSEYQKAIVYLYQMASDGQLIVGSKIPSERELAQKTGISRNSTREAISILRGIGIVESRHGSGNYVSKDPGSSISMMIKAMLTKVHYNKNRTVENNFEGLIDNPTWEQVEEYISKIIINEEEFVTLTLSDATYGIRYIQACKVKGKYSLQLGLEKDNSTNLVEAFFDQEELRRIFLEFYTYGVVANKEAYKPLLFET